MGLVRLGLVCRCFSYSDDVVNGNPCQEEARTDEQRDDSMDDVRVIVEAVGNRAIVDED